MVDRSFSIVRKCLWRKSGALALLLLSTAILACSFSAGEIRSDSDHYQQGKMQQAREIIREFLGRPYQREPLGEGEEERIYREDVFDCTTFVLTVAARMNAGDRNASKMMKWLHYHPPGEVSFEHRLHYSSYRNRVSDFFENITSEVGGRWTRRKRVVLNRERSGKDRLIPIDWEREVVVEYIPCARAPKVLDKLPEVAGAGFVRKKYFRKGLGIAHEGIVLDGTFLAHASSEKGKVTKVGFLEYLESHRFTGVSFFRIQ